VRSESSPILESSPQPYDENAQPERNKIEKLTLSKGLSVPNVFSPLLIFSTTIGCSTANISLGATLYAGAEAELWAAMLDGPRRCLYITGKPKGVGD
jgi:hypothetical protein